MGDAHAHIDANLDRFRDELFEFLRIPSVSARSEHDADMRAPRSGLPARCAMPASRRRSSPRRATRSSSASGAAPAPARRPCSSTATTTCSPPSRSSCGRRRPSSRRCATAGIFARGSVDDKGQLFLHVKALEAHLATRGRLPVNVDRARRGRGGGRQREPGAVHREARRRASPPTASSISDSSMFAPGHADDRCRRCAGWPTSRSTSRARAAICTPAATAARS